MRRVKLMAACLTAAIAGALLTPGASAQQTFRVYKNDGTMSVFFYSTLDSITFDTKDGEENIVQIFHTADSAYRFKMNEIDSVAFGKVPTVYKQNNVLRLDGELRNYVTGSEELTLFVRSSVPEHLLPKRGVNVATLECDDVLPNGFFGKVESVNHGADGISIVCSQASLLDIFESLGLEGTVTTEAPPEETSRGPLDVWPPKHFTNTILPKLDSNVDLHKEIKHSPNLSADYTFRGFAELTTKTSEVTFAFFIVPMPFQTPQVYIDFTFMGTQSFDFGISFSAAEKWEKRFKCEEIRNIRIPGLAAFFEFHLDWGIFMEVGAEVGLNGSFSMPLSTLIHCTYDNKAPAGTPPCFSMKRTGKITGDCKIEGDLSVSAGMYGVLGVAPVAKEMLDISPTFKIGARYSSMDIGKKLPPIEDRNTDEYDRLNIDDFYKAEAFINGEIEFTAFNKKDLGRAKLLEISVPFFQRGVVPRFSDVTMDPWYGLEVSAKLERDLMYKNLSGFALYNEDTGELIDTRYVSGFSHMRYDFSTNTLKPGNYIIHPITIITDYHNYGPLVCNPPARITIMEPLIGSFDIRDFTEKSASFRADIDMDIYNQYLGVYRQFDNYHIGFFLGTDPNVEQNGIFIPLSYFDTSTSYRAGTSSIQPETEYYYKPCAIIGDLILAPEETKRFVSRSDIENVKLRIEMESTYFWGRTLKGKGRIVFENLGNIELKLHSTGQFTSAFDMLFDETENGLIINATNNSIGFELSSSIPFYDSEVDYENWSLTYSPTIRVSGNHLYGSNNSATLKQSHEFIYNTKPKLDDFRVSSRSSNSFTVDFNAYGYCWIHYVGAEEQNITEPNIVPYSTGQIRSHYSKDDEKDKIYHSTKTIIMRLRNGERKDYNINYSVQNGKIISIELP